MLKRIISIVLTVLMCMSMVTFTAMADTTVSVTYLNADSTKIMVDLSAEVAVADLKAAITLTAGDTAVTNFEVVKKPANPTATTTMTSNTDISYVIIPEGGITFDVVYNLKIASSLLGAECNRYFSVEQLWKDDFQSYTTSNLSWSNGSSGTNCTVSLIEDGNNKYMQVVNGSGASVRPYFDGRNFSTYGKDAATFFNAEMLATKDYTVELKTRSDMTTTDGVDYKIRPVRVSMQSVLTTASMYYTDYICGGGYYAYKSDGSKNDKKMVLQAGLENSTANRQGVGDLQGNLYQIGYLSINEIPYSNEEPEWNTLTLAAKGQNVKVFAGDDAFINYNHTISFSSGYGAVVITANSNRTYYIDDVIATKMTELTFGNLEIPYWNADSTKIMLDLSAEVDADALKNAITLTKDDEPVENFTVVAKPASPTSQGTMTANANYSYVIEPQDGIALSTPSNEHKYSLTVAQGLISKDQTKRLSETYSVNFAVDKLWIEDFENETYNTSAVGTFPWKDHGETANLSLVTEGDNTVLEVSNTKSGTTIRPNSDSGSVFADTGLTAAQCWNSAADDYVGGFLDKEDYSVEATVRALETTASSQNQSRSIRIFMQSTPTTSSFGYASGVAGGGYYAKNASTGAITKQMYAQVGLTEGGNVAGDMQGITTAAPQVNALNPIDVSHEPFASTYSTLSMSVKDKNVKVFAGDNAFISYNYTLDVSDYGCVAFTTHSSRTFYLDDIVVTKAREVVTPDFGTSLTVIDGTENTKTVSWTYDGKGNDMPCKLILASYGANNSLKNVSAPRDVNLSGNGTITFENFDPKGGTELKLFVWKDLINLYPYCATIVWPQAN